MISTGFFRNEDRCDVFAQGRTTFREGDAGATMYVVLDGNVTLSVKSHVVEELGPGGVPGEPALQFYAEVCNISAISPGLSLLIWDAERAWAPLRV